MRTLRNIAVAVVYSALVCQAAAEDAPREGAEARTPPDTEMVVETPAQISAASENESEHGDPHQQRMRMERFRALPPEKQKELIERYKAFQQLPEDQQRRLRMRLRRWHEMSAEDRKKTMDRYRQFREMPLERHRQMRRRWGAWQAMPEERKQLIRRALAVIRDIPPDEMEKIKALPEEQRREALKEILRQNGVDVSSIGNDGGAREDQATGPPGEWRRMREGQGRQAGGERRRLRQGPREREQEEANQPPER